MESTKISLASKLYDLFGLNKKFNSERQFSIEESKNFVISPVEAEVFSLGNIEKNLIYSKNKRQISLEDLFGSYSNSLDGGYVNLYLNPFCAHYFVTPYEGKFVYTKKTDGNAILPICLAIEMFGETKILAKAVKKNAYISSVFQTEKGSLGLVAVGSFNVNRIQIDYEEGRIYPRGMRYGCFNLGSSMIVCFPKHMKLISKKGEKVKIGESLLKIDN